MHTSASLFTLLWIRHESCMAVAWIEGLRAPSLYSVLPITVDLQVLITLWVVLSETVSEYSYSNREDSKTGTPGSCVCAWLNSSVHKTTKEICVFPSISMPHWLGDFNLLAYPGRECFCPLQGAYMAAEPQPARSGQIISSHPRLPYVMLRRC